MREVGWPVELPPDCRRPPGEDRRPPGEDRQTPGSAEREDRQAGDATTTAAGGRQPLANRIGERFLIELTLSFSVGVVDELGRSVGGLVDREESVMVGVGVLEDEGGHPTRHSAAPGSTPPAARSARSARSSRG